MNRILGNQTVVRGNGGIMALAMSVTAAIMITIAVGYGIYKVATVSIAKYDQQLAEFSAQQDKQIQEEAALEELIEANR